MALNGSLHARSISAPIRTLVIGLDGCSWNVLEPLLETGELPNLSALREQGASGVLESTVPFYTGPAWASYATGCSPAAHGIYDFMMLRADGRLSVASQSDLRRPTYYRQLGAEGKRSVLINLPLDQDGCEGAVIVNSWLTDDEGRRIFPLGRRERYSRLLQAYRTFPAAVGDVQELCSLEQARFDLARELFLGEDWDHFFVLFSSTDWLGHALTGKFLRGDESAGAALLKLYRQIDRHIGWLVDHAGGAAIAVVSDHGQCEETAVLRVNSLLRTLGLVSVVSRDPQEQSPFFVDRRKRGRARITLPPAISRHRSSRFIRPLGASTKKLLARSLGVEVVASVPRLDRTTSRAFMPTDASFAVYVNDPDGSEVASIRQALREVKLSDDSSAIDGAWTVQELYGQSRDDGPLMFVAPANGVRLSAALKEPILHYPSRPGRGCHQRDGIVILAGAGTKATDLGRLSIYDIAPTLLWAMEAGVPRNLDGRVAFEAFEEAFAAVRQVNEVDSYAPDMAASAPDGESAEVTRRLKALGYI